MVKSKHSGFTLIELVVVIVILGILAAFAVPRFMGLEGNARASTIKSLGGAMMSAATMARAKCQAQECGPTGTISVDGTNNVTMVNGYPNAASIQPLLDASVRTGFIAAVQGNGMRFTKTGGGANCWVQYNQAASATVAPTITYFRALPAAPTAAQVQAWNTNIANDCRG